MIRKEDIKYAPHADSKHSFENDILLESKTQKTRQFNGFYMPYYVILDQYVQKNHHFWLINIEAEPIGDNNKKLGQIG